MSKEVLKDIQRILKLTGLYAGIIDGVIGWKSYSAVLGLSDAGKYKQASREIQQILAGQRVYFGAIDGLFGGGSMTAFNNLMPAPKLTDAMLQTVYKNCAPGFAVFITQYAPLFGITTKADLFAFLANNIHESGGFKDLRENMNYSAARLLKVFPKYFKTQAIAQSVAKAGPVAIANFVYGGRMGNSKTNDDGFNYRGGGCIHLTGRENYTKCDKELGLNQALVNDPDIITRPEIAIKTALWFWKGNKCSGPANKGEFNQVCHIVNGGSNGLAERNQLHQKLWNSIF